MSDRGRVPEKPGSWIADTVRTLGLAAAVRFYGAGAVELLRNLSPMRRKSRYGDIDYDFDHGVDTTWATVSFRTRIREVLSGGQYQPSEPTLFHELLGSLPTPFDGFTFIDLGSGKGRTLLMASVYPFKRIIGVELLAELNDIAIRNIRLYRDEQQKCFNMESHAQDARNFQFPVEPTILYLFNPFPEHVLKTVLSNLEASYLASPREFYVVYHNLVHHDVFLGQKLLRELRRTHQYAIYKLERT